MARIVSVFFVLMVMLMTDAYAQKTRNVIVVTLDGYRWREVFEGADKRIFSRSDNVNDPAVIEQFNDSDPEARRRKLMPFFWNVIARDGQLYGNRDYKNKMQVTNARLLSYPGYSEMFVGFADRRVKGNKPVTNPNYSVLEALNNHEQFADRVAVFSTWNMMPHILREDKSGIHINSGGDKARGDRITRHERRLNRITSEMKNPHGDRYDRFTFQYAMEYLTREKPRVLFISFDETDEHGHGGRYDEYLKAAHKADSMIQHLWQWVQSTPAYKDETTLIIGTDHGRGTSARGWKKHAIFNRGSSHVWLAVLGPDSAPLGEVKEKMKLKQGQVAKTIGALLGIDYTNEQPVEKEISLVIRPVAPREALVTTSGAGQ